MFFSFVDETNLPLNNKKEEFGSVLFYDLLDYMNNINKNAYTSPHSRVVFVSTDINGIPVYHDLARYFFDEDDQILYFEIPDNE